MFDLKRVRPLDAAIAVAMIVVIGLGGFLGYSVWSQQRQLKAASPVYRGLDELVAAVRENPDDLTMRVRLAQALMLSGRRNEAVKQYESILKVKEDHAPALAGLGTIALREKDYKTAENYYRQVIEIAAKDAESTNSSGLEQAYFYLGTAIMEQKRYEEAAGYFKEALRLKRDSSTTHYLLAVCLRELELPEAYRESLGNTLLFDPKHPEANYDYGRILLDEGDEAGAAEHFRLSADSAPNIDIPRKALEELGPWETRIEAARAAAKSDRGKALVEARVAAALRPRSVETFVLLGDLYADAGNEAKAREAYSHALGMDAGSDAAKAGLERVGDGS